MNWVQMIVLLFMVVGCCQMTTSPSSPREDEVNPTRPPRQQTEEVRQRLVQLDPVEVNHEQRLTLSSGQVLQLKTLAKEPPLFEIPGFLSMEECEHIKQLALEEGLFTSTVRHTKDEDEDDETVDESSSPQEAFSSIDANQDGILDGHEMLNALDLQINAFLLPEDTEQLIRDLHFDQNGDGVLSLQEFADIDVAKIAQVKEWTEVMSRNEAKQSRVSQQAWLYQDKDKVLEDLRHRVVELTGLPKRIIQHSEPLQVVYYEPGGHFHAHYDSSHLNPATDCSHTSAIPRDAPMNGEGPRLCRFITILYYLDDTIEGGQTAFPVADNDTFDEEDLSVEAHDLTHHCEDANLYVRPEKGKAVMWYNHYLNATTGWMGAMNPYSLHGGCFVKRGTKWLANNWINAHDSYDRQMLYMDTLEKPATPTPEDASAARTFAQVVTRITGGLVRYLQTPAYREVIGEYFAEEPAFDRAVDVLVDYINANAQEVRVNRPDGEYDYGIIWDDRSGSPAPSRGDEIVGDLSGLISTALDYLRSKDVRRKARRTAAVLTLRNPAFEVVIGETVDSDWKKANDEL